MKKKTQVILKSVEERTALLVEELREQISAIPSGEKKQTRPKQYPDYEEPAPATKLGNRQDKRRYGSRRVGKS